MFICSVKPKLRRLVIITLGVLAAIAVTVIVYFNFRGTQWALATAAPYTVQAEQAEQCIAFFAQFGWQVESQPVSEETITLPQQFSAVYERYNALQQTHGMDLTKYAGQTVTKAVYRITNFPAQDTTVYGTLLLFRGKVIGGDLAAAELDGFMCNFYGEQA